MKKNSLEKVPVEFEELDLVVPQTIGQKHVHDDIMYTITQPTSFVDLSWLESGMDVVLPDNHKKLHAKEQLKGFKEWTESIGKPGVAEILENKEARAGLRISAKTIIAESVLRGLGREQVVSKLVSSLGEDLLKVAVQDKEFMKMSGEILKDEKLLGTIFFKPDYFKECRTSHKILKAAGKSSQLQYIVEGTRCETCPLLRGQGMKKHCNLFSKKVLAHEEYPESLMSRLSAKVKGAKDILSNKRTSAKEKCRELLSVSNLTGNDQVISEFDDLQAIKKSGERLDSGFTPKNTVLPKPKVSVQKILGLLNSSIIKDLILHPTKTPRVVEKISLANAITVQQGVKLKAATVLANIFASIPGFRLDSRLLTCTEGHSGLKEVFSALKITGFSDVSSELKKKAKENIQLLEKSACAGCIFRETSHCAKFGLAFASSTEKAKTPVLADFDDTQDMVSRGIEIDTFLQKPQDLKIETPVVDPRNEFNFDELD